MRITGRHLRRRLKKTLSAIKADIVNPPYVPPGHYYSPRTSPADVDRAIAGRREPVGIDLRRDEQIALAKTLNFVRPPDRRWSEADNTMYGAADASILRAMLLNYKPKRFVEVGSGLSTAVVLDVAEESLPDLHITCVEPYADRLRSRLRPGDSDRLTLIEAQVQSVSPADLVNQVEPGDFFFIDSTHVVKSGSDVCHLLLHTIPLLPVGAIVHVHDIFWPFEYTDEWMRKGRDWTEIYLLQAFLINNDSWRIILFGSWLWTTHPELAAPGTESLLPGSIWLERFN